MTTIPSSLDSESLVTRIIAELQADPNAQTLLLRALLTNEFLGMPIRLERIEADVAELKADVAELNTRLTRVEADVAELKADVAELNTRLTRVEADVAELKTRMTRVEADVAVLKGDMLEVKLHRRIRPLISQRLGLRRAQVLQSPVQDTHPELFQPVEEAFDAGVIDDGQETRINATDLIVRAQRKANRTPVWVAVEVSNAISQRDLERARQAADALNAVFSQDALAVVIGYRIQPQDQQRWDEAGVRTLLVEERDS